MKALNRSITFLLILIFLFIAPAHSATISVSGDTVDFHYDSALTGLFGAATVNGDSLFFNPTDFSTEALNSSGSAWGSETFNVRVVAKNGANLSNASLSESGQYVLNSSGEAFVNATGTLTARDTNNPSTELTDTIAAAIGTFDPTGLSSATWAASAGLDLAQLATGDAMINIGNILLAGAFNLGDIAIIQKNFVQLTVDVAAVPIPAAIWLFGSALVGLTATGRRRLST